MLSSWASKKLPWPVLLLWTACFSGFSASATPTTFKVASYNVENYLLQPTASRTPKAADARAQVRQGILKLQPDVLALQEMGDTNALMELRAALKADGLDYPFYEHISGADPDIHVAVLSRFPFSARQPQTNDDFLLNGRRFHVSRGFAQVTLEVNTNYFFTLLVTHLKSKRSVVEADETELRLEEAKILRQKVDALLQSDPDANILVAGDFNDTKNSASTRAVLGRGKAKLIDVRPAEQNGDSPMPLRSGWEPRNITWTHYYRTEDSYARIDFLLASPGMARELRPEGTYVLAMPNWGAASDHRPIVATFMATDQ